MVAVTRLSVHVMVVRHMRVRSIEARLAGWGRQWQIEQAVNT